MITLFHLTKKFKNRAGEITAIDSLNFEVKKGEIFGLIGPNGAGKTTTVKVLSTLITPTYGTAIVNGYDIIKDDRAVRASIGVSVGDERSFYYRLSGYQNLEFFGALYGLSGKALRTRIESVVAMLDLKDYIKNKFMNYSLGMKKKLNLARALLCDPPIYFFDEPTSSLDIQSALTIRALIENLRNNGKTILLTSHNMFEIENLCDRIVILKKGKILVVTEINELKKGMQDITIRVKLSRTSNPQFKFKISQLNYVRQIIDDGNGWFSIITFDKIKFLESVYKIASECNAIISDLEVKTPNLEDVFISIAGVKNDI